jgi:flavin reductase (DIM6/NTAB) family NADH-FMN oxidoreductase RutF
MITIKPETLTPREAYRLAISIIAPRPIAWVSSIGADGTLNLAPFSFFNIVGHDPVTVMVSIGSRRGESKDTLRNIRETREFVVNIADESLVVPLNESSGEYTYEVNEFERAALEPLPSELVKPPRVAVAPIALEVRSTQIIPVEGTAYTMCLGEVVRFHIREGLLRENGLVDTAVLRPLTRLGGDEYGTLGRVFELARPKV